jgi:2-polyprenyl-3-methyl-5-hydroxy-6-metoxy-1,4-benzoquinol methylase
MASHDTALAQRLKDEMAEVAGRVGPWQSHNIYLGHGVWTIADRPITNDYKLDRIFQLTVDVLGRPLDGLRVLDVACEEGMFGLEFARHGASVLGVEGRDVHVEKARFAARALGLDRFEVVCDDVRNITEERYGEFDLVLCLGILYHLEARDQFDLIANLQKMCRGLMVVDTETGLRPKQSWQYEGRTYHGRRITEHRPESTEDERMASLRASLDNVESDWLTRWSLVNLIADVGFSSVYEALIPTYPNQVKDRITLVAANGPSREVLSAPGVRESIPPPRWDERGPTAVNEGQSRRGLLVRVARRLGVTRFIRRR